MMLIRKDVPDDNGGKELTEHRVYYGLRVCVYGCVSLCMCTC